MEAFDYKYLNEEVPEFRDSVPTTEMLTREIFRRLSKFPKARLERVRVEETSKNSFEMEATNAGSGSCRLEARSWSGKNESRNWRKDVQLKPGAPNAIEVPPQ